MILLAFFFLKYNRIFTISFVVLGLSSIGGGVTRSLEENGFLDHNSLIMISPFVGVVFSLILMYISGLQMAKNNKEITKLLKVRFYLAIVFLIPFLMIIIWAYIK